MKLEEYKGLPDRISVDKLKSMFNEVLINFKQNKLEKNVFLEIISELTDRQVMTYEVLDYNVKNDLDIVLSSLWNTDSYDDVDIILSIVVNLGLEKCYKIIKESIQGNDNIDKRIVAEVLETIEENGDDVANPYRSLEKFK